MIFDDDKNIHLQAEHILIVNNGSFEIGSAEKRFQHKAVVTLHGHVRSKELPVYGAKSFSLRSGHLGLYGRHVLNTWTRLADSVEPGTNRLRVTVAVKDWKSGDEIVIASTSKSIRENEVARIVNVSADGKSVFITPPLKYKHVALIQHISGRRIETAAEIGLLSRNVVIRGSRHSDWDGVIEACPQEFDPDQFAVQTCFDGRYGEERAGDQFGVQIMIHSGEKGKRIAVAHFDHVEITHAGQAGRLGRYPIHFHMEGDVHGSYVKGCAIHR